MGRIDWLQVLDGAGGNLGAFGYVYLSEESRLMLAQLMADDAMQFPGHLNWYQGDDIQDDLFHEAIGAYDALMNPINLDTITQAQFAGATVDDLIRSLSGLGAYWPMSSHYWNPAAGGGNPTIFDVSANGNHLEAINWPSVGSEAPAGIGVPFVRLDGRLSQSARLDTPPNISIKGYEQTSLRKGLTLIVVARFDTSGIAQYIMDRWSGTSTYRSWIIWRMNDGRIRFNVCDGSNTDIVNGATVQPDTWAVLSARYKYNDFIDIGVNLGRGVNSSLSIYNINAIETVPITFGKLVVSAALDVSRAAVVQQFIDDEQLNYLVLQMMNLYGIES